MDKFTYLGASRIHGKKDPNKIYYFLYFCESINGTADYRFCTLPNQTHSGVVDEERFKALGFIPFKEYEAYCIRQGGSVSIVLDSLKPTK